MSRWEPDAPGRLARAALELYVEHGFDQTTVAQIAQRAGLTERTFFRHFADKREVLFRGSNELESLLVAAIAAAPEPTAPIDAIAAALDAAGRAMQENRDGARLRQSVIVANPELRERELIKLAKLSTALAAALRERGVDDLTAELTAEAGIAVFRVAFTRWVDDAEAPEFPQVIRESLDQLKAVTAGT